MIDKVKTFLGIEGVKVSLELPMQVREADQVIHGRIKFSTMHPQKVTGVKLKVIENYNRGRRKSKVTDEYEIGFLALPLDIKILADEDYFLDFELPFLVSKSDMDKSGDQNPFLKGLVGLAKIASGVYSTFKVEVKASVKGTALDPVAELPILIK